MHDLTLVTRTSLPLLSSLRQSARYANSSRSPNLPYLRRRQQCKSSSISGGIIPKASNVSVGSRGRGEHNEDNEPDTVPLIATENPPPNIIEKRGILPYIFSVAFLLLGCASLFSLIVFAKGGGNVLMDAIAKSGLTAAFTLIFVSEIGDKTFFIAALLAMQYEKWQVLIGCMGALSLMTILSVIIGRIFHAVPAQFQTTLPIGEYSAIALLIFFGLKSIKDAWDLPPVPRNGDSKGELDEYVEAEELVKEKVATRLTSPFEVIWKSFSLTFVAEWGDRSMLATMALGAAQSPWGVASGAIAGHLVATTVAILGGAFLANYISEKLVGYLGGGLFLTFAAATFLGVF